MAEEKAMTKVKDLNPECKQVNVLAKVMSVGEAKEIPSKFGRSRKVAEATIGDETGVVTLSLWQDQIGTVQKDDVIFIDNGFVSLVRGRMRLNVGKYGGLQKTDKTIESVDTNNDMSAKEYPYEPRAYPRREMPGGDRGGFRDRGRDRRRIGF
jgi:replication factor A1